MKILLVSPCRDLAARRSKFLMIPQLALHLLAGLTPPEHEVKIVEEEIEDINFDEECDLVGISCMTANAPRAYRFAQEFRKRGKKVVLGGIHPTILPDEALQHADSVVIGEAEGVWEQLLEDAKNGRLQKKYYKAYPSLDRYVQIRSRRESKKRVFDIIPVMTTRGCPFKCDFCCVYNIFGPVIRHIPVKNVIQDIVDSEGKNILFLDDNVVGDPGYAKELFTALKPLGIKWAGQASMSLARNPGLMRLAVESGCRALFFGLESVSKTQLLKMRKSAKSVEKTEEEIKKIRDSGIYFHPSLIFGFDDDTKDIFPETLEFLERNRISSASLNILTPYPGTKVYNQFLNEGRLITLDWKYYNHSTVVFKPRHMEPLELQAGRLWTLAEFVKISSILKRLPFNLDYPIYHLVVNIGTWWVYRDDLRTFPRLAYDLFPISREDLDKKYRIRPWTLKIHDLIPHNWIKTQSEVMG